MQILLLGDQTVHPYLLHLTVGIKLEQAVDVVQVEVQQSLLNQKVVGNVLD